MARYRHDQVIEAAQVGEEAIDLVAPARVERGRGDLAGDALLRAPQLVVVAAGDAHFHALRGQEPGCRKADPGGAADDDGMVDDSGHT